MKRGGESRVYLLPVASESSIVQFKQVTQMAKVERKYFIVKHGLDAFQALPNFIWRLGKDAITVPHRFSEVRIGDRWIGFAYTTSDRRERSLSRVTGFYECIEERAYGDIPPAGLPASDGATKAWLIEGEPCGEQPIEPVGVPPIADLLNKTFWKNQGLVPITEKDFDFIREFVLTHQFDTKRIPLVGREPENEQELLASQRPRGPVHLWVFGNTGHDDEDSLFHGDVPSV